MASVLVALRNVLGRKRIPIFLIIGAQKAGTTALHNYLCQHPSIRSATTKEIHFFSTDLHYSKGLDYYHSKFHFASDGSLFLDASPSYLASEVAYKRIYKYNPNIKMIVLLRDPVDRAYSAWSMYRARYQENRNWFFDDWVSFIGGEPDQYIKRSDEEVNSFEIFTRNEIQHLSLLHPNSFEAPVLPQGLYGEHLSRFLTLFKRDQLMVIESSFLREHTSEVLEEVESFISVRKFDWGRINLSPVFEGGYSDILDQSATTELSKYYAPHNEALYKLLGRRYDWK